MSAVKRFEWLDTIVGTKRGYSPSQLDATERAIALALLSHMNADGTCEVSLLTLAAGAGVARSTVDRALVRLEQRGFLEITRSPGRRTNRYRATVPTGAPGEPVEQERQGSRLKESQQERNRSDSGVQPERQARHEAVEALESITNSGSWSKDQPRQEEDSETGNGNGARGEIPDGVYVWMNQSGVLPSKLLCSECGTACVGAEGLAAHMRHGHPDADRAWNGQPAEYVDAYGELISLRCPKCDYIAGNKGGLVVHQRACRGGMAVAR